MRRKKRLCALLFTMLLSFAFSTAAYAHDVPDMSRTGSITAVMTYDGESVGGGSLTLYRVGDVSEDDGNYSFTLTDRFAGSGASLEDVSNPDLAELLAGYADENGLEGTVLQIGTDGTMVADGLVPGLYLVVQEEPADGFAAISPFLVSLPMYEDGAYVYDVNVEPKMGGLTPSEPTPVTPPGQTPQSSTSTERILPQTGQLNWPVPVLTVLGLSLLLAGWAVRNGKQEYEA